MDRQRGKPEGEGRGPASDGRGGHFALITFTILLSMFVALHVLRPGVMARTLGGESGPWIGGLNVAMILGLGLIIGAMLLAVIHVQRRP